MKKVNEKNRKKKQKNNVKLKVHKQEKKKRRQGKYMRLQERDKKLKRETQAGKIRWKMKESATVTIEFRPWYRMMKVKVGCDAMS